MRGRGQALQDSTVFSVTVFMVGVQASGCFDSAFPGQRPDASLRLLKAEEPTDADAIQGLIVYPRLPVERLVVEASLAQNPQDELSLGISPYTS